MRSWCLPSRCEPWRLWGAERTGGGGSFPHPRQPDTIGTTPMADMDPCHPMPSCPPNLSIIVEPPPLHTPNGPRRPKQETRGGQPAMQFASNGSPVFTFFAVLCFSLFPSATPPPAAAALSVSRLFRTVPLGPLQLSQSPPGETCARARDSRRRRREDANPELRQEDDPSRRYTTATRTRLDERRMRNRTLEHWQAPSRTKPRPS